MTNNRVWIGWFNTAEAAGRAADKLAPAHPSSTLVISQIGPNCQWVLAAHAKPDEPRSTDWWLDADGNDTCPCHGAVESTGVRR